MPFEPDLNGKLLIMHRTVQNVQQELMVVRALVRAIARVHKIDVQSVETKVLDGIANSQKAAEALQDRLHDGPMIPVKPQRLATVVDFKPRAKK